MAKVTLAANEEIWDLLDDEYIQNFLGDLNVNILFSCVNTNKWKDDSWVEKDGTPYHIIKLPYEVVKSMNKEQVRALMLEKTLERLQQAA
ncbi:MAG TPA: hypothetical protein PLO67_10845 [Saprospiraceae bacterium]|nr:hypothetical protein [Saprospiraceae bacterium]